MTEGTTPSGEQDRDMIRGYQLERDVRLAMAAANVASLSELARRAKIQRDTLYAWFRGERPPKPDTLQRVADVLDVRLGALWDYGPAGEPVTDLAGEIRAWRMEARVGRDELVAQVGAIRALLEAWIGGGADAPGAAHAPPVSSRRRR